MTEEISKLNRVILKWNYIIHKRTMSEYVNLYQGFAAIPYNLYHNSEH